jgi:putative hydrolase of HD superfamily
VKLAQILARNEHTAEGSEELWEYAYQNFLLPNVAKGKIRE